MRSASGHPADSGLQGVSEILAIRLGGIGDVVLALPAMLRLRSGFPGGSLTLLTDTRSLSVPRLCPRIDRVIEIDRRALGRNPLHSAGREILRLARTLRSSRFDLAVDFHGLFESNLICGVSGARYRMAIRRPDKVYLDFCFNLEPSVETPGLHLGEIFDRAADRIVPPDPAPADAPCLRVPDATRSWARALIGNRRAVAFFVGASRVKHRWPAAGFATAAAHAARQWGAAAMILGGGAPVERSIAEAVGAAAPPGYRFDVLNGLDMVEIAGIIGGSELLVSNDSGPMHLGSALGVPTIGIFGVSSATRYAPRGPKDRYVKKPWIGRIEPGEVIDVMEAVWSEIHKR